MSRRPPKAIPAPAPIAVRWYYRDNLQPQLVRISPRWSEAHARRMLGSFLIGPELGSELDQQRRQQARRSKP